MKIAITLAATLALAGCAAAPDQIAAAYVSPVAFSGQTCGQLNAQAQQLNARLATATGQQTQQASNDAALTAVALVLFWPAALFIGGNDQGSAIAQMRGEAQAIQSAAVARGCR
jgi:starvation-inducible outer membrane lipoprotein